VSSKKPATPNRRFQFQKCGQFFIRTHNETLSVAAMAEHMKTGCSEASEAKYMEQAKAIMTPEQYAKFKEEYDRLPQTNM